MAKNVNYTDEQTVALFDLYAEHGTEGMDTIVDTFNERFGTAKTVRSIRAKIGTLRDENGENIYVPMEKPEKVAVDRGPTKKELLATLAATLESTGTVASVDVHKALAGATKDGIEFVLSLVADRAAA